MPWPNPRFTVGTGTQDACVTDNLTGLIWVKTPDSTLRSWQEALDYAKNLNVCGFSDWRIPTIIELESMVNAGQSNPATWLNMQGFSNVYSGNYWSSTTYASQGNAAWIVDLQVGFVTFGAFSLKQFSNYAWPVRDGQTAAPANIWETGQKTCYDTSGAIIACIGREQDGDLLPGVTWPNPRFSNNGNGTVTDRLTGLIWLEGVNCFGAKTWDQALIATKNLANGQCGLADGSQAGDWRLPNRKEMLSLADYSGSVLALYDAFGYFSGGSYWSSTTVAHDTSFAWHVDIGGNVSILDKTWVSNSWPVRGGQTGSLGNLTISKSGPGTGTVTSSPAGINCGIQYSSYSMQFPLNRVVMLSAIPSTGGSIFSGWSNDSDCLDGIVTLDADKTCVANFDLCNPASVTMTFSSGPFASISAAYAVAASTDVIKVIASNQEEGDLVFVDKNLTLQGGYDCAFTEPPTSFTTVTGSITISGGGVVSIGEGEIRIQ